MLKCHQMIKMRILRNNKFYSSGMEIVSIRYVLCVLALLGGSWAYSMIDTVRIDGIRYELRTDDGSCSCTVLNSEDTIIYKNSDKIDYEKYSYYEGDIVIPETVSHKGLEYRVTRISDYAFAFCSELKSVVLPASLKDIGDYAFEFCVSLEDIVLPNSVRHIGVGALSGCFRLKSVQLSTALDTIPEKLFSDCYQLKEVEIPEGVVYLGHSVFANCYMLDNISFPSTLKKIGNLAKKYFQFDCRTLANVFIRSETAPEQVYFPPLNYYGGGDENPEMLNKFKMPCVLHVPAGSAENYASAEGWNFFHSTVEYDPETGPDYSYSLDDDVRYSNNAYSLYNVPKNTFVVDGISYTVLSENELTCSVVASKILYHDSHYVIPEKVIYEGKEYTVVSLSNYSFCGCISVKSILLPETIKEISDNSIVDCYSLESMRLPESVESFSFSHLPSLNELIIESNKIIVKNEYATISSMSYYPDDIYLLNADNPKMVSLIDYYGVSYRKSKPRLHVTERALPDYMSDPSFSNKWTLVGIPSDDPLLKVKATASGALLNELHYGIDGREVAPDAPGLHIIRNKEGGVSKVFVR